jgi:hypothetical protein
MSVTRVRVILSGGPTELAKADRSVPVTQLDQTLKLRHGGGYEHFVHHGEYQTIGEAHAAVFRWTDRTKIAE